MLLDLREIIESPGGKVSFEYEPDLSKVIGVSILKISQNVKARGTVKNQAGIITFNCLLKGCFICACARCLKEFEYPLEMTITADITQSGIGENPDGYYIQGNNIDADEIIVTELIMNLDEVFLCRSDCAGLCQRCGKDLNLGMCTCSKETDSRLSVLKQLLD